MRARVAALVALIAADSAAQSIFTVAGGFSSEGRPATVVGLNRPTGLALDPAGSLYIAEKFGERVRRLDLETGAMFTIAGDGSSGFRGDGGPAADAAVNSPDDVALDGRGNLYIADQINHRIRRVDLRTGVITTFAGTGSILSTGDGGPATAAGLYEPHGVAVDRAGNVFVADYNRIRRIDAATGIITSVAGNGTDGFSGDGGPATQAQLNEAVKVAVDGNGNLFIADALNHRIRRVAADSGIISTVAGTGTAGYSGDGGLATAARLDEPRAVRVDQAGNIYIADLFNSSIRKVESGSGVIRTIAGSGRGRSGFSGDGGAATSASLTLPQGLEVDSSGTLYISDLGNLRVRKVDVSGTITTVAGNGETAFVGDGGPATTAELSAPKGVALDSAGNIYVADSQSRRVRRIDRKTGIIETVAGTGVRGSSGDGGPATRAQLRGPTGLAIDASDNLYIVDTSDFRVRKVDARTGIITAVAGNGRPVFGGDKGPATAASFLSPTHVAVDREGNVYINDTLSHRVRRVSAATQMIDTIAGNGAGQGGLRGTFSGDGGPAIEGGLSAPSGLALDDRGNLYIGDASNLRIRRVDAATGIITTIAGSGPTDPLSGRSSGDGGPATDATFNQAIGVAFDEDQNILVLELTRVRRIDNTTGIIQTVAGNGDLNYTGDGGPATAAGVRFPDGVASDAAGNLFLSDGSGRVRAIFACLSVAAAPLVTPADRSSGVTQSPRLQWAGAGGAFRYDVLLDTENPPRQIVASDVATPSFAPSNLEPLTTYFWQVIAKGDPFCVPPSSSPSSIQSFTTTSSCTNPGVFETVP